MVGSAERRPTEDFLFCHPERKRGTPPTCPRAQGSLTVNPRLWGPSSSSRFGMTNRDETAPNLPYSEGGLESAFPNGLKVAVSDLWRNS